MTTESLTTSHALAIRHGWEVYRAAMGIAWPEDLKGEIATAVMDLWAPLTAYSLTLNVSDEDRGTCTGDLGGLPDKYAKQASKAVCRLTRIISSTGLAHKVGQPENGGHCASPRMLGALAGALECSVEDRIPRETNGTAKDLRAERQAGGRQA
jgi:hypothetical protein